MDPDLSSDDEEEEEEDKQAKKKAVDVKPLMSAFCSSHFTCLSLFSFLRSIFLPLFFFLLFFFSSFPLLDCWFLSVFVNECRIAGGTRQLLFRNYVPKDEELKDRVVLPGPSIPSIDQDIASLLALAKIGTQVKCSACSPFPFVLFSSLFEH